MRLGIRLLIIVVFTLLLGSPKLISKGSADGGANHQERNLHFGVSGGNVNDITKRFCCSGTLGALVKDNNGALYILSNNHVLGLSGKANAGEDISQPGRIDNNCQLPPIVADFTVAPTLGSSNVDAAIAQLRPGSMDESGFIEDIGIPSSSPVLPTVGTIVVKSGRTTGFTTGTIGSINTSVNVQYQANCGSGKKFTVSYTNQVVINSSTFSAGGDSGSLIVTNTGHNPVALLFAGSSTTTIANPIGQVLTQVSNTLGRPVSFVGNPTAAAFATLESNSPTEQDVQLADVARGRHERALMARQGVIGVGTGGDGFGNSAVVVYVDRTMGRVPELPGRVENVPVRVVLTDPFVAF